MESSLAQVSFPLKLAKYTMWYKMLSGNCCKKYKKLAIQKVFFIHVIENRDFFPSLSYGSKVTSQSYIFHQIFGPVQNVLYSQNEIGFPKHQLGI